MAKDKEFKKDALTLSRTETDLAKIPKTGTVFSALKTKTLWQVLGVMKTRRKRILIVGILIGIVALTLQLAN